MRIAIVGAGAIGTWLGAALARTEHDVAVVARGAHLEAMRSDGIRVTGSERYLVAPAVTDDAAEIGSVDAVLLCVKAHDQVAAAPHLRPLLGADTAVVAAQNGIPWWYFHGVEGPLAGRRVEHADPGGAMTAAVAPGRALGLVVYMGAAIVEPGVVSVRPEAGLVIGEPSGGSTPRVEAIAGALEAAGFPVRRSADIRTELWTKLMGNASFNPISLLTRAGLGAIGTHPGVRRIVATAMRECVAIARATGANPTISIEDRLAITARLGDHKTSTLQDLEAGKRVELDALLGAVVELAELADVPAPTLTLLLDLADLAALSQGVR